MSIPFVAVGAGEEPPWGDDLTCPTCGTKDLPLQASLPGDTTDPDGPRITLHYISHCGGSWLRGPITRHVEGRPIPDLPVGEDPR